MRPMAAYKAEFFGVLSTICGLTMMTLQVDTPMDITLGLAFLSFYCFYKYNALTFDMELNEKLKENFTQTENECEFHFDQTCKKCNSASFPDFNEEEYVSVADNKCVGAGAEDLD